MEREIWKETASGVADVFYVAPEGTVIEKFYFDDGDIVVLLDNGDTVRQRYRWQYR